MGRRPRPADFETQLKRGTIMFRITPVHTGLRFCSVIPVALFATLALAATAGAATITGGPSTFTYSDTASQTNTVSVTKASSTSVDITDSTGTLTESSSHCTSSGSVVTCTVSAAGTTVFNWNLGSGDDSLSVASDVVTKDSVNGELGADAIACGGGADTVTYASRTAGVRVTPDDGTANDGELTELDNVGPDCEASKGGSGGDFLFMATSATAGIVDGSSGDDYIVGSPNNASTSCAESSNPTQLIGGYGNDTVINIAGGARVQGYYGNDLLVGGDSCEHMFSGHGSDTVFGGGGDDQLLDLYGSTGESNTLVGGAGSDTIVGAINATNRLIGADGESDYYACLTGSPSDTYVGDSVDIADGFWGDGDSACETLVKN
jgi:Ca2+-binding RTX toxin-like protein